MQEERVLHRARLHPLVLLSAATLCAAAAAACLVAACNVRPSLAWLCPLALLPMVPAWLDYRTSEFGITERRLIVKRGWLRTRTNEALLTKLGTIGVEQGLLGRALGFGTVIVRGPGGAQEILSTIADPISFSREIQRQMVRLEQKPAPAAAAATIPIPLPEPAALAPEAARLNAVFHA